MITKDGNYAEWALLVQELDDAREHLDSLTREMTSHPEFDETEFQTQLEHIYSHLNRAWNGRNQTGGWTKEHRVRFSGFPSDLQPS